MSNKTKMQRESLILSTDEWAALHILSVQFNTIPRSGPNTTTPTWRTLIKQIAQGNLVVSRPHSAEPANGQE